MAPEINEQFTRQDIGGAAEQKSKLSIGAHIMCGWPLLLVAIGGLIGGALGGGAYALNIAIHKSNMPVPVKVVLNIVSGLLAIIIWFVLAVVLNAAIKK
jgi:hypothetical protein